jgi:hypothetical protein
MGSWCNNPLFSSNSACLPAAGSGYTILEGGPPWTVAVESSLIDAIRSSTSGGGEGGGVELDETTGEGEREGGDGVGVGEVDSSEE